MSESAPGESFLFFSQLLDSKSEYILETSPSRPGWVDCSPEPSGTRVDRVDWSSRSNRR